MCAPLHARQSECYSDKLLHNSKCVNGFAPKLLCDMIVMASDVNVGTLEIQIYLMFIYQSQLLNATENLLDTL